MRERAANIIMMTTKFTFLRVRGAAMRFRAVTGYGLLVGILLAAGVAECQGGIACSEVP